MKIHRIASGVKQPLRTVIVASDEELTNPVYREGLWNDMRGLGLSGRGLVDFIANTLYRFDGLLLLPDGTRWYYQEVDEVINYRTILNFLQDVDGKPRRVPRKITPLRYYDAPFRIKWPHIARHIFL